jgi:hypothetical protein
MDLLTQQPTTSTVKFMKQSPKDCYLKGPWKLKKHLSIIYSQDFFKLYDNSDLISLLNEREELFFFAISRMFIKFLNKNCVYSMLIPD